MGRKISLSSQLSSSSPTQGKNNKFCYARGTARHSCEYRLESWTYRVALLVYPTLNRFVTRHRTIVQAYTPLNIASHDNDDDQDASAAQRPSLDRQLSFIDQPMRVFRYWWRLEIPACRMVATFKETKRLTCRKSVLFQSLKQPL